jgi:phosphoribosyl 1,2-cyclic phosphate phosphodiesterase
VFDRVAYLSDCNGINKRDYKDLNNLKYLIIDCLKINPHPSHFNLDQAIKLSNLLKPKKTILTNLHTDLDYNFLKKNLPKNIRPAYDGLSIYI